MFHGIKHTFPKVIGVTFPKNSSYDFCVTDFPSSFSFLILSLAVCRSSDVIIVSRHNEAAPELKLRLGCFVLDDDEMIDPCFIDYRYDVSRLMVSIH